MIPNEEKQSSVGEEMVPLPVGAAVIVAGGKKHKDVHNEGVRQQSRASAGPDEDSSTEADRYSKRIVCDFSLLSNFNLFFQSLFYSNT